MKRLNRRVRGQRPHKRVFPPAATNHKYPHATAAYPATTAAHGPGSTGGAAGDEPRRSAADWCVSDGRLDAATPRKPRATTGPLT